MKCNLRLFGTVVGAVLFWVGVGPQARAGPGDIYDLGTLGGSGSSFWAVNDAGQVVGSSNTTGNAETHAFRYDGPPGTGVMRDLGALDGTFSDARGVNASGQAAGTSEVDATFHAHRYDGTPGSGGIMRDLGTLNGNPISWGYAVNASGQVVGDSQVDGGATIHAFRYDGTPGAGGVMRDLGAVGGNTSQGRAINDAGQVAGSTTINDLGASHAFRYDGTPGSGGVMRDLGTLGGDYSSGGGINASGQVVGTSALSGNSSFRAFRYDGTPGSGGIMRQLEMLAGGEHAYAWAINDAAFVIGDIIYSNSTVAALWRPDLSIVNLDEWLDVVNPIEGAKWTLESVADISNTGWIVGKGIYDPDGPAGGSAHPTALSFLLDASSLVPEPGHLSLLGFGAAALFRRRSRAR